MANRIRAHSWSEAELGPIEQWPAELVSIVNLMLASREVGTIFWGPGRLMIYNDHYITQLGTRHPASLGRPLREVWPDVIDQVKHLLDPVFESGTSTYVEDAALTVIEAGYDTERIYSISCEPVWVRTGSESMVRGVYQTAVNNTARVRAERQQEEAQEALVKSEEHLRLAQQAAVVCSWEIDPATSLLFWTGDTQAIYGRPAEQLSTAENVFSCFYPDDLDATMRALEPAFNGTGEFNHEFRVVWPDGSVHWLAARAQPVKAADGHVTRVIGVNTNVTERKTVELEKSLLTEEFDQVLTATTDAVVSVDRQWHMTYFNARAEELYGPSSQYVGRTLWEAFPEAQQEDSPFHKHLHAAMDEGTAGQFEAFYPEPLSFWISMSVYPTRNGIVLFTRDTTDARKTHAALLQNEKLAAVGRLAASIAHEINNPLESVTNLLYLARTSKDSADIQGYLDLAERELRRVSVISNQTLRFYKQSTAPREVSCSDLFESVLSIYQGRIVNSRIEVERRNRASRPIECFDGEIRQVLNNLVGNAIDAMHPQGGRLLVRSREACDWRTGQKGVALTIADTGSGMPPQVLRSIFDAFYTTKGIGGTGLGLWVSKEIVDRHHGTLVVRSSQKEGRSGTVFSLFLPYHAVNRST